VDSRDYDSEHYVRHLRETFALDWPAIFFVAGYRSHGAVVVFVP